MKKIVALILALVMVMGLATVASAAELKDGDVLYAADANKTPVTYVAADSAKDGSGNLAYFTIGEGTYYVECAKGAKGAVALYANEDFLSGDKVVVYIKEAVEAAVVYDLTGVAVKAEKWSCTNDEHAKGYYSEIDKTYYVDAEDDEQYDAVMYVDGKLVKVDEDDSFITGTHLLYQYKSDAVSTGVYVYKCAFCGKEFNAAMSKAYAGKNYVEYDMTEADVRGLIGQNEDFGEYVEKVMEDLHLEFDDVTVGQLFLLGQAAPEADADKVESAQTFDAGIAMYVGMSVMAAAGSAVVLKKKD